MKIGPKYKIARRLGAPVFEKTQTQKYALSESRKSRRPAKRRKQVTDFGLRLREKQKGRYSYGMSEKVFGRTVREAVRQKGKATPDALFEALESRLDSVLVRSGFGPTRFFCKQLVSHGHILVNDKKVKSPSHRLKKGDTVRVKPSSLEKGLFKNTEDADTAPSSVSWLTVDMKKKTLILKGVPTKEEVDLLFDIDAVLEFYSR